MRSVATVVIFAALGLAGTASSPTAGSGPCTAAQTRSLAFAFARVWSRGDATAVDRLVVSEPQFRWVSAGPPGERSGQAAYDRRSLGAFILRRHRQHDRLAITRFRFNGSDLRGTDGFGHFEFDAIRRSDDWPAGLAHARSGKGAIVCTLPRAVIAVWSLG